MKTILGVWSQSGNTITGTVDISEKASAVIGSESDSNYTHQAQLTLSAGAKAGLIVNHTYDSDFDESYIAMYLDAENDVATLEFVSRNQEGVELGRLVLASRTIPIVPGSNYDLAVESKVLSDGAYAVYGKVNGFTVVEAEDLLAAYGVGQRGFEIEAGTSVSFNYAMNLPLTAAAYGSLTMVKYLCNVSDVLHDTELNTFLSKVCAFIDNALKNYVDTLPVVPATEILNTIAEYWAAGLYLQKDQLDEKAHHYVTYAEGKLAVYIEGLNVQAARVVSSSDLPIAIGETD